MQVSSILLVNLCAFVSIYPSDRSTAFWPYKNLMAPHLHLPKEAFPKRHDPLFIPRSCTLLTATAQTVLLPQVMQLPPLFPRFQPPAHKDSCNQQIASPKKDIPAKSTHTDSVPTQPHKKRKKQDRGIFLCSFADFTKKQCNLVFLKRSLCIRHIKYDHLNLRPYSCSFCRKNFTQHKIAQLHYYTSSCSRIHATIIDNRRNNRATSDYAEQFVQKSSVDRVQTTC